MSHTGLIVSILARPATALAAMLARLGRVGRSGPDSRVLDDLVTANHILAERAILDGYGHVSARSESRADRFFLSRAKAPALVTAVDLIEYDLEGNALDAAGRANYIERHIHAAIYRARPDVRAVVHAHTPSLLPFACSSVPLRPIYHMSAFLAPGVPVFEIRELTDETHMLVADAQMGEALARSLGDKALVLMRGHGAVIVASSIPAVVSRSVYADLNARMQAAAIALGGTVTYLETGPTWESPEPANGTPPYDRDWELWKRQAQARQPTRAR